VVLYAGRLNQTGDGMDKKRRADAIYLGGGRGILTVFEDGRSFYNIWQTGWLGIMPPILFRRLLWTSSKAKPKILG